jgi:protein involved in polysaccharide export with SLBB domain
MQKYFCNYKNMCKTWLEKIPIIIALFAFVLVGQTLAQQTTDAPTKVNFGYSQNPKTKAKKENTENKTTVNQPLQASINTDNNSRSITTEEKVNQKNISPLKVDSVNRSIAKKTLEIVNKANAIVAVAPTETYKVGIGDVLFINLQNAPTKTANYFTVLNDGTLDYALASETITVLGLTTDEIENLLTEKIKLYENPQVSVKMREYASHIITVLGLVEKAGEKYLQREAIPLYVVRAEAIVQTRANGVTIKRANSMTEKFDMKDPRYEEILVFPGDIVEFTSTDANVDSSSQTSQFYYIGGNVVSVGQKDFYPELTLTQAILASGGLKKASAKKVVIRRKNNENLLVTSEYNLKEIKEGKLPDPVLQAGDTVEIGN